MPAKLDDERLLTDPSTIYVLRAIAKNHNTVRAIEEYTQLTRGIINNRIKRLVEAHHIGVEKPETLNGGLQGTYTYFISEDFDMSLVDLSVPKAVATKKKSKPANQLELVPVKTEPVVTITKTFEEKVWLVLTQLTKEVALLKTRLDQLPQSSLPAHSNSFDETDLISRLNNR